MKQSKLRRRRVIRFAILYYVMLVLFLALVVGPAVLGDKLKSLTETVDEALSSLPYRLVQPNDQDHNNTNGTMLTGTGAETYTGTWFDSSTDGGSRATDKIKLF